MTLDVELVGLEELQARLETMSSSVWARITAAMDEIADLLADRMRSRMAELFRNPGVMQASVSGVVDDGPPVVATVGAYGLRYLRAQELGGTWMIPEIFPVNAKALAFFAPGGFMPFRSGAATGDMVFTKHTKAHPVTLPERSYRAQRAGHGKGQCRGLAAKRRRRRRFWVMPTREEVFQALAALVQDVPGINYVSRRMAMPAAFLGTPGNVSSQLPALLIWEQNEATRHEGLGIPPTRTWSAWLVVYFQNPDATVAGATIINPILDGIEAALAPNIVTGKQTLGGLVSHAWIEGPSTVALGDIDTQGFGGAVVEVHILVP